MKLQNETKEIIEIAARQHGLDEDLLNQVMHAAVANAIDDHEAGRPIEPYAPKSVKNNGASKANGEQLERLTDQDFLDLWEAPHCNPMELMKLVRPLKLEFGLHDSTIVDMVRVALAYLDGEDAYFTKNYPGLSWVDRLEPGAPRKPNKRAMAANIAARMRDKGSTGKKAEG
jgi:hypothetical protein